MFFQLLLTIGVSWDDPLPYNIIKYWQNYISDLSSLERLRIPFCLKLYNATDIQFYEFSDAFKNG